VGGETIDITNTIIERKRSIAHGFLPDGRRTPTGQ